MSKDSTVFFKNNYSDYWSSKRPLSYINTDYDNFLISLVPTCSSSVLEACCGNGIPFSFTLARSGLRVFGFDISESLISQYNQLHSSISGVVDDIYTFGTQDSYDCLFIYHSLHLLPNPYLAIESLISNCPNITSFVVEFSSIYFPSNSILYSKLEALHSSRFNMYRVIRYLKNIFKRALRVGSIDSTKQNIFEPVSIYRIIDSVELPYKVYGVSLSPFAASEITFPVSADRIIQYDRLIVVFTR